MKTSTAKTRDRKIKINDIIYVFRVPVETSLDAEETIKKGLIKMIKVGIQSSTDVFGNALGATARTWNCIPPHEVEWSKNIHDLILKAIHRTKSTLKAAEDLNLTKPLLPRLTSKVFRKQLIERDETVPRYFIRATAYCRNCLKPIPGTHTIYANANCHVGSTDPFVPDDPEVTKAGRGRKGWLHKECSPTSIPVSESAPAEEIPININVIKPQEETLSPDKLLDVILENQTEFSSELARGASLMYHCFKKHLKGE